MNSRDDIWDDYAVRQEIEQQIARDERKLRNENADEQTEPGAKPISKRWREDLARAASY
jgi:hypothetical protein